MIKNLFHKNSVKIFELLERTRILKLTRAILSHNYSLTDNIPLWQFILTTPELHKSNDWYGHATILKKYAGIENDYSIKAAIEHGPFFSNFIWPQDVNNALPVIITFSKNRAEFLKNKTRKKIFSIGPYIHYAQPSLTLKQIKKERKRLGKNLLVFPVHETSITKLDYNIERFCKEIKKVGKRFDSIRVCLYWKDILSGKDKYYKKQEIECVTAGHVFDPMFLSKLKSIIALSNSTMSNGFGTYIGYSIFMRKPHYLFLQKIKFQKENIDTRRAREAEKTIKYKQMKKAFSKLSNNITTQQYNLAKSFYGFGQIKSSKEIRTIFKVCEKNGKILQAK